MKKRMLKLFLVSFVLAIATHLTAQAAGVTFESEMGSEMHETAGTIKSYSGDFVRISGEALTHGGLDDVVLQIGDAPVYDLITGLPVPPTRMKPGMDVRAAYYTLADGPQQAMAIWLNPDHEDAAVFSITVSSSIYYGPDYVVFLSSDKRYRITLTTDSSIYVPGHGQVGPHDVVPGQEFFVWVDMITASSPALVFPDKVVSICQYQ